MSWTHAAARHGRGNDLPRVRHLSYQLIGSMALPSESFSQLSRRCSNSFKLIVQYSSTKPGNLFHLPGLKSSERWFMHPHHFSLPPIFIKVSGSANTLDFPRTK